jgi:hypothetical protein
MMTVIWAPFCCAMPPVQSTKTLTLICFSVEECIVKWNSDRWIGKKNYIDLK